MFSTIFSKENVRNLFRKITQGMIYQEKDFPKTICEEKMDSSYYTLFLGMDAIIKYMIIIKDMDYFDDYLIQLELLLRKVDNHNEIVSGINKLLMNYCKIKLGLKDVNSNQNKEEILKYIYRKYIAEGYYFHSFPSVFLEDVMQKGLHVDNYNYELESLKEIDKIFKKYNFNHVFSKNLEVENSCLFACDSFFMGCFYAYHSPYFLNEVCTDLVEKNKNYYLDCFFKKDYARCKKNLGYFMKKAGMFNSDMNSINQFFAKEWDLFYLNESRPVMAMIKRNKYNSNYLEEMNQILEKSSEVDLITSINKLLEIKNNAFEIKEDISQQSFEIIYLPTLEELGFNILKENKKQGEEEVLPVINNEDEQNINTDSDFINEYGNTTIIALLGVLFITIGITITLIMLGR